ncbi:class I SAM-dependent methyltransferase [Caldisalinibacter kiritimatiensis]|uniref:Methyltransferase domain-containing protein n=1 Tax=Caldisalinibacter kiritimatiensis TaxID=1304284 RepID=R1CSJ5_9FIRM|nr:class I SAM-dependent methyltransferase [Caldisalinibacter kiritimatiensis]EOC99678.1 hypothetical protein L21TH_2321 [Caldisalinibacter kiritimatiensis]
MSDNTNKKPEEMKSFFEIRADGYDEHMRNNVDSFEELYSKIAEPIEATEEQIKILDLGCGTGLELDWIFKKAPNLLVVGIDLSEEMLNKLKDKYQSHNEQITLIKDSYLTYPFEEERYDYVISVMTMHHWLEEEKMDLYRRIKDSLTEEGKYIEGDYVVNEKEEKEFLRNYKEQMKKVDENELYHIDIPMTEEKQIRLLKEAGFKSVEVIHRADENKIFVATK